MLIRDVIVVELEVEGIGRKIRDARLALPRGGKTLRELCKEAGVSKTYWYSIEKEDIKGFLSIDILRRIEKVLGIDLGIDNKIEKISPHQKK